MHDLFRAEAVAARSLNCFGAVALRTPLSFAACAIAAAVFASAVLALLWFGEYTRRTRVVGVTVPAAGVIRVLPPQAGLVLERHVDDGARVRAGDLMFVLSNERLTGHAGAVRGAQHEMIEQLRRRHASLDDDRGRHAGVASAQQQAAERRLRDLLAEAAQLQRELATQQARLFSAQALRDRFARLAQQGFVSDVLLQQKADAALDQQARVQALERAWLAARRDAAAAGAELAQLPLRAGLQQGELQRAAAAVAQEIASIEGSRRALVVAPQDGVVTAVLAEVGQVVSAQPLATLLPHGTAFDVHLFAPSRAAGFVDAGQAVRVRFAAFPYQKFGQHAGEVIQVSRTALAASDLPSPAASLAPPGEGVYRIAVRLQVPHVRAYGRELPLVAGMQVEADIAQDRRRLIEWVFEPLIGLRGRT